MQRRTEFDPCDTAYEFDMQGAIFREAIEDAVVYYQERSRYFSRAVMTGLGVLAKHGRYEDIEAATATHQDVARMFHSQAEEGLALLAAYQWDRRKIISTHGPYAIPHGDGWRYSVYLNGRELMCVSWADEIRGQVETYVTDKDAMVIPDKAGERGMVVILSGDVRIHRRSGPR